MSVVRGPDAVLIRADTGDIAIMTSPPGARTRPATRIDWPSP
jgi:hypothetical protein